MCSNTTNGISQLEYSGIMSGGLCVFTELHIYIYIHNIIFQVDRVLFTRYSFVLNVASKAELIRADGLWNMRVH